MHLEDGKGIYCKREDILEEILSRLRLILVHLKRQGEGWKQTVGTAMGTSFSVVYAVIFMIWLETPIVNDVRFRQYIRLLKRFIDDLFLIWTDTV